MWSSNQIARCYQRLRRYDILQRLLSAITSVASLKCLVCTVKINTCKILILDTSCPLGKSTFIKVIVKYKVLFKRMLVLKMLRNVCSSPHKTWRMRCAKCVTVPSAEALNIRYVSVASERDIIWSNRWRYSVSLY